MRAAKTSKLVSTVAILGLIATSVMMVLILNSATLASPTLTLQSGSPSPTEGPTGTLTVQLYTNQDERDRLSNLTNRLLALGGEAVTVTQADNSSSPFTKVLVTNRTGGVFQVLPPRHYLLNLAVETLSIKIPVQVSVGNDTRVVVTIRGAAYPLVYSEESGVVPVAGRAQFSMFAELRSPTSIANVSDPVLLKVRVAAPGAGYLVNATVVGQKPPSQGTQWLELVTEGAFSPVDATSIVLTTWTYSSTITVLPIGLRVSPEALA